MSETNYTKEQIIDWYIWCSAEMVCYNCPLEDDCLVSMKEEDSEQFFMRIALRAAELLNAALEREKKRQWISVKDRLPDKGENVIVRAVTFEQKVHVDMDFRSVIDGRFAWDKVGKGNCKVTHWMPLPEPPESPKEKP